MSPARFPLTRLGVLATLSIFALSSYLLFHHVEVRGGFQTGPSFCSWSSDFDCDAVARSRAAELFGIPVAGWGIIASLILLGMFIFPRPETGWNARRYLSALRLGTAVQALGSVVYAGISILGIGKVCILCSSVHLISLLLFAAVYLRGVREGSSIAEGVWEVLSFLRSAGELASPRRGAALLAVSTVVLLYLVVLICPAFMVLAYFQPRELKLQAAEESKAVREDFRSAKVRDIPLVLEGEPADRDFSRGAPNAKVTAVMYSDFECPHCRDTAHLMAEIEKTLPVLTVYKNFPLDNSCNPLVDRKIHEFSCLAAEYARCAGIQGKFWEAHDVIFSTDQLDRELIEAIPARLGLDRAQFQSCLDAGVGKQKVTRDIDEGVQLKIRGTPAIYLNGRFLPGADRRTLEGAIRELLIDTQAK